LQRVGDGVSAVLHAKLGQDGLYVVANGFGADVQLGSDLTVAAPGGKHVEDLALTASQCLPAQQHHFPGAALRYPASQHAQLRQRRPSKPPPKVGPRPRLALRAPCRKKWGNCPMN
jgi:hypothetical protein